jgi:hypothetical protein
VYTRLWVRAKIFCCDRNRALLKSSIVIEKKNNQNLDSHGYKKKKLVNHTKRLVWSKLWGKKSWNTLRILQNVIEKSLINWRVLSLVKINTRISETPCIHDVSVIHVLILTSGRTRQFIKLFNITFCKIRFPRFFAPQFLPNESFCVINWSTFL